MAANGELLYEVLMVGAGRDAYALLLGLSSDERLPE